MSDVYTSTLCERIDCPYGNVTRIWVLQHQESIDVVYQGVLAVCNRLQLIMSKRCQSLKYKQCAPLAMISSDPSYKQRCGR